METKNIHDAIRQTISHLNSAAHIQAPIAVEQNMKPEDVREAVLSYIYLKYNRNLYGAFMDETWEQIAIWYVQRRAVDSMSRRYE